LTAILGNNGAAPAAIKATAAGLMHLAVPGVLFRRRA